MRARLLTFGPFVFDCSSRLLKRDGVELPLPPRVGGVLEVLLQRAGEVVSRQELMDSVWKDAFVTDTSLGEAISVLRQTLGDDAQYPVYIQTLHRRGYRFVAAVTEGPAAEGLPSTQPAGLHDAAAAPVSPSIGGQLVPWSAAAICAVLAAAALIAALRDRRNPSPAVTRFVVEPAPGTRFDARAPALALSADASHLAFSACDGSGCRLYARPMDRVGPIPLPGTEEAAAPFFSPDGRWIGFFAQGALKKVAIGGGSPVTLADASDPLGAVWTTDNDVIYAGAGAGLTLLRDASGEPVALTTPSDAHGETRHAWPSIHPDSRLLLFTIFTNPEERGPGRLGALRLDGPVRQWTTLMAGVDRASLLAEDLILFSSGGEVRVASFDPRRSVVSASTRGVDGGVAVSGGAGQFAHSPAGAIVTVPSAEPAAGPPLFWWSPGDRPGTGSAVPVDVPRARDLEGLTLSPDGRRLAGVERIDAARADIWIVDLERGAATRVTHSGVNGAPRWSADGSLLVFASGAGSEFAIQARATNGHTQPSTVHRGPGYVLPSAVAPDGSVIAFTKREPESGADVWGVPLAGGEAAPLVRTPFDDVAAVFSPDGRLLAYQCNDAGRWEVYLHRRSDGHRIVVSTSGGTHPFWSADGRSLFFRSGRKVMRSPVAADGGSVGAPEVAATFEDAVPVAADPNGRILFQRHPLPAGTAVVALHWLRQARQLLGPPPAEMPR